MMTAFALGCSNADNIVQPGEMKAVAQMGSHQAWGLWQFTADPGAKTLDVMQLRTGSFHLNVLPFLEPPPLVNLTIENLEFNGNIINVDIGLRNPFVGFTKFTGFDVCGILITNGSETGFNDPDLRMPGDGDTRLLNPDGLSRWWNPAEFPVNNGTIFSYQDGLLGAPDSIADYNSTLNAYKYFCDDLGPDNPLGDVALENRGIFSAGQKNIRHYTIEMGLDGLIFNYAVDACWKFPSGGPPWTAPDDFPPGANRPEAWLVEVAEVGNTLWNDGSGAGGNLLLSIDVYDWYNAGLNSVKVESPGNLDMVESTVPSGGGAGYSTYEVEILDATPAQGSIDLLVSVECENMGYDGFLPGKTITAYFTHAVAVASEPSNIIYVDDSNTSGIEDGSMAHPYNTIQEGVDAAQEDNTVLVDDSGNAYEEQVDMKSNIIVQSSNWDDSDGTGRAFIDGPEEAETHSVYFNSVENATLEGFRIGFAGAWPFGFPERDGTHMIEIDGGADITIRDCLFTGNCDLYGIFCIVMVDAYDVTIEYCSMSNMEIPVATIAMGFSAVEANNCPGLTVSNNVVSNICTEIRPAHKNIDVFNTMNSDNVTFTNNRIDYFVLTSGSDPAQLVKGFYFQICTNIEVANNTIDRIDTCDAFFINQCFGYFFDGCSGVGFTNNIATHIYSSGSPSPLARGVCAYNGDAVTCDFTDIWDIGPGSNGANYHGSATPGIGAISANPLYIDPDNKEYDISSTSLAQNGDPDFVDWDDTGPPSGDPDNTDPNTRSRMGCHGGPGGEHVGLLT